MEEKKTMSLLDDVVFKNLLKNPNSRWYVVELTASILNMDLDYVMKNLTIRDSEMFKYKDKEKGHVADSIIEIDNYIINYEANNKRYNTLIEDKVRYLYHLYNISFPKNSLGPSKKIIQVHINNFDEDEISDELIRKNKNNIVVNEYERIITYSLDSIEKKWYNKTTLSKTEKLLLILKFGDDEEKLNQLKQGDDYLMNLDEKYNFFKYITDEMDKAFDFDADLKLRYKAIGEYEGEQKGREQGREEGLQQGKLDIASKLIKINMPEADILSTTGITKEQYQELINKNS